MVFIGWIADGRSQIAPGGPRAAPGRFGAPQERSRDAPDHPRGTPWTLPRSPSDQKERPGGPKKAPGSSRDAFFERSVRTCVPRQLAERFSVDLGSRRARLTCTIHHCQWCFVYIERFSSKRPSDHQNDRKCTIWATEIDPDRPPKALRTPKTTAGYTKF